MNNLVNKVPFLRTSRNFPEDLPQLTIEVNKSYVDIANSVNNRIIGIFPTNMASVTGESWFIKGSQKQQSLRQAYNFTGAGNINIGFKLTSIFGITKNSYGSYTDGTSWYGVVYASSVVIAGQVSFFVTVNGASTKSDIITVLVDGGAPAVTSGTIVLEWLANP
jgi:hypothetical protein